ncbi:MAG: glycosyltransferase [Lachnospiraceae bacterium]|nr:glycosyltransferase [Candidatus Colinaster equi]
MKILIVISTLNTGGAQKIVSQITTNFPDNWDIDILLNDDSNIQFPYKGNIISLGLPVDSGMGLLYQIKAFLKRVHVLKKMKKENGYKTCISFMDSGNVANIVSGNRYCETMITINNNMSMSAKYRKSYRMIVNPLIKLFYNRADKINVLCQDVLEDMVKTYHLKREKMGCIYCSIEVELIKRVIEDFKLPAEDEEWFSKDNTVVSAGRFVLQKGHWHLIRAFNEVHKMCPEAKLVIFGSGPLEEYFNRLICDYGMQDCVCLHQFSNKLVGYISKSAVFAFPSVYEGFGTALQEALCCNTACVASDYVSGGREQLDPRYASEIKGDYHEGEFGILIEEMSGDMPESDVPLDASEKALAEALIKLIEDADYRKKYADVTINRAKEFDIGVISKQWIEAIEK